MALQWLTDGMETSLAALFMVLLPMMALGEGTEPAPGPWPPIRSFLFGAAVVLLRVEMALALFFAVLGALPLLGPRRLLRQGAPLALGGLGGMAALLFVFGHVLADTAVAKRGVPMSFLEASFQVGRSTAASLTLGAGLAALWCCSLLLGLRGVADRRGRTALLSCNLLLPCLIAFIGVRGQILHGVRHVLWVYLFLISWNLVIAARSGSPGPGSGKSPARGWKIVAAAALLAFWIFEGRHVASILGARGRILLAMRSEPLARLQGATGAGFDIGFVSFFTGADILDFSGLVNGRVSAALAPEQRLRQIAGRNPDFLFVTGPQAEGLRPYLDLSPYRICYRYRTLTLTEDQFYFLAVRPGRLQIPIRCEQRLAGAPDRPGAS
jgi:hypothetical protein